MYEEILENLGKQLSKNDLDIIKDKTWHLGVFNEPYLSLIINKVKKVESRFTKYKVLPYQKIKKDDVVFLKKSSGMVLGYFIVSEVLFIDLKKVNIESIKKKYNNLLCLEDSFYLKKQDSNYVSLIYIKDLCLLKPFAIHKKGMQTWVKLN